MDPNQIYMDLKIHMDPKSPFLHFAKPGTVLRHTLQQFAEKPWETRAGGGLF